MKIRDVMRANPITIDENDDAGAAYRLMTRNNIRHLPVMHHGKLVGMMSDRDILVARACADDGEWWRVPVHFIMKSPAQTASPDDSLTQVAARLAAARISAFPIVQLGKILGIVTVTDVLEAEVRQAMGNADAASSMT